MTAELDNGAPLLTPESVQNKNFTATQFRRGYDEQEVDDFMDEVVTTLRSLSIHNERLRLPVLQRAMAVDPAEEPSVVGVLALAQKLHEQHVSEGQATRDRLVAEGEAIRSEAKGQISEMRERASGIVAEAKDEAKTVMTTLVRDREALDKKIAELRVFRADHHAGLQTHIEDQLAALKKLKP